MYEIQLYKDIINIDGELLPGENINISFGLDNDIVEKIDLYINNQNVYSGVLNDVTYSIPTTLNPGDELNITLTVTYNNLKIYIYNKIVKLTNVYKPTLSFSQDTFNVDTDISLTVTGNLYDTTDTISYYYVQFEDGSINRIVYGTDYTINIPGDYYNNGDIIKMYVWLETTNGYISDKTEYDIVVVKATDFMLTIDASTLSTGYGYGYITGSLLFDSTNNSLSSLFNVVTSSSPYVNCLKYNVDLNTLSTTVDLINYDTGGTLSSPETIDYDINSNIVEVAAYDTSTNSYKDFVVINENWANSIQITEYNSNMYAPIISNTSDKLFIVNSSYNLDIIDTVNSTLNTLTVQDASATSLSVKDVYINNNSDIIFVRSDSATNTFFTLYDTVNQSVVTELQYNAVWPISYNVSPSKQNIDGIYVINNVDTTNSITYVIIYDSSVNSIQSAFTITGKYDKVIYNKTFNSVLFISSTADNTYVIYDITNNTVKSYALSDVSGNSVHITDILVDNNGYLYITGDISSTTALVDIFAYRMIDYTSIVYPYTWGNITITETDITSTTTITDISTNITVNTTPTLTYNISAGAVTYFDLTTIATPSVSTFTLTAVQA